MNHVGCQLSAYRKYFQNEYFSCKNNAVFKYIPLCFYHICTTRICSASRISNLVKIGMDTSTNNEIELTLRCLDE